MRTGVSLRVVLAVAFLSLLFPTIGFSSDTLTLTLFGPDSFIRDTGSPIPVERIFALPSTQGTFTLRVINGDGTGDNTVSSAVVSVNGIAVVKANDFNQSVNQFEISVPNLVEGINSISVKLASIPSSYLTISIIGDYFLNITITDPLAGSEFYSDRVTVRGTYVSYSNDVAITVNGVVATVTQGTFVATDVPLVSGSNTITAAITTVNGIEDQDTIHLTSNLPPVAKAGQDVDVVAGETVTLDGRQSHDPEESLITYQWSFVEIPQGSSASLSNSTSVMPSFVPDLAGSYVLSLVVNDGTNDSPPDDVTVKAEFPNVAPTANAGEDQSVITGSQVYLNGTTSFDPDGDTITFLWQFLSLPPDSHAVLSDLTSPAPSFLADVNGRYILSLRVNDGELNSLLDEVVITAETPNAPPVANAGADQTVPLNALVQLDGTQSTDPDNNPLTFTWSIVSKPQGSTSLLNDPTSSMPTILADVEGDYVFRLMVSDGQVQSDPNTVVVTVGNAPPVANAGPDIGARPRSYVYLDGSASFDPNGDPVYCQWNILSSPPGATTNLYSSTSPTPYFIPDVHGEYVLQLIVDDGSLFSAPDTVVVSVHGEMIPVPDLGGMSVYYAHWYALPLSNLALGTVTTVSNATVPIGLVLTQNPPPGTLIEEGSLVDIVVSSGVVVPYLVGMPQAEAQATLQTNGLYILVASTIFSDTISAGSIISQNPVAGTAVDGGSTVHVVVSLGPRATVPMVMGMSQIDAESAILGEGLGVGPLVTISHPTVAAGRVLKQTPIGGTFVPRTSSVDLVVSSGPATTPPPPDPALTAPVLDGSVETNPFDATQFLYTGSNPLQTGVSPGTIEFKRISVVRGMVRTRENLPLPGVTVTILGHSEFGQTLTREDGMFDLAVNGGGVLTVRYEKAGYLAVQRQVSASWQKFEWAPDVVLTPYDSEVTAVDLSSPAPVQVARGSLVSDDDGGRQATVLFTQGTQANLVFADGSTRPISSLSVRATEYTVGPQGPSAMPAKLPPSSAYTYCVELSVDEAVVAGAVEVRFDRPVTFYVENFIGLPDGEIVPVGYYDRQKGVWVPSANGKIVKVLGATGGLADLDVNGDGVADTGSALTSLGITDAERERLALLYPPGTSLWRVAMTHFTPWDCNYPPGLPPDAYFPPPPTVATPKEHPDVECGSVIDCQNQTLGESVHVVGTPFDMVYKSDRMPGHLAAYFYRMEIPVTGSVVPVSLRGVDLNIEVEGQRYRQIYSPSPTVGEELLRPNITYIFQWDGKDAYGRPVQGIRPVKIRIGYTYELYYARPALWSPSFGLPGSSGWTYRRSGSTDTFITQWDMSRGVQLGIGGLDARAQGFGGWTINANHVYHPGSGILYEGNGNRRNSSDISQVITTVAGNGERNWSWLVFGDTPALHANVGAESISSGPDGSLYFSDQSNHTIRKITKDGIVTRAAGSGLNAGNGEGRYGVDGVPAVNTPLNLPTDVTADRDGNLYIADWGNHRVRRVGLDGIITTVAGIGRQVWNSQYRWWYTTDYGYSGDGGPAVQAKLYYPRAVAVGPDGSLYIVDSGNSRIRRVGTDGTITTVAGNGQNIYAGGDGGPALNASIAYGGGIAVGSDGTIYFAEKEYGNYYSSPGRIRRIGPDGVISTVAGGFSCQYAYCLSGDGGPAIEAWLAGPTDVAVQQDGTLYIAEAGHNRIRRVGADGIIATVAGIGYDPVNFYFSGDGGPATQAYLANPSGIAVSPDGFVYFADTFNYRIRRLGSAFPGLSANNSVIASEDGRESYIFDRAGRHKETINSFLGGSRYRFDYDTNGLLDKIVDGDGNATVVERDGSGIPIAIAAPGGQRTTLSTHVNGYLSAIADPGGNVSRFTYTPAGLLETFTDPNGFTHSFSYDELGLLAHDSDPEGGFKSLSRSQNQLGSTVAINTALARTTTYAVEKLFGGERRVRTSPSGAKTIQTIGSDGTRTAMAPDGTTTTVTLGPDPIWGMEAPIPKDKTVETPDGLVSVSSVTRTASLVDPDDLSRVAASLETVTKNGRTFTQYFDGATRSITFVTAAGRNTVTAIDNQGRLLSMNVDPSIDNVIFGYDPQGRLAQTGQGNQTWIYGYDSLNRLTSVTDPIVNLVQYGYDDADRVSRVILPSGRTYGFLHDNNGNLTQITMPSGAVHGLGYTKINLDNAYAPPGNPPYGTQYNLDREWVRTTLPSGRAIDGGYDNGGRLNDVTYPEAAVSMTYFDNTERVGTVTRTAAPVPDNTTQTIAFSYDGFLTTRVAYSGVANGEYRYSIDNNFWVVSVALDNVWTTFGRDADGLLTQYGPFTIMRSGPAGAPSALTDNVLNISYTYDSFGRLESRTHVVAGQQVYQLALGYDNVGRIAQKIETVSGTAHTFDYSYDVDGQLFEVRKDGVLVEQYSYDNNANRTSTLSATSTYDDQDRLIQRGGVNYTFDDDGYLTARGSDTFTYSARGELLSATVGGHTTTYQYDGVGRRIGKTDAAGTTQYLYGNLDNTFQMTASRDPAGVLTTYFYDVAGDLFAFERNGQRYYVATDHLGTPNAVTDSTGAIVKTVESDAWGVEISNSNPSFDLPIGFAGGIPNSATGLVRFGWRDYEAGTGRWSARDPIFFNGGMNLYQYAANNPVNWVDPEGTLPPVIWAAIVSGGALAIWAINWWYEATHPPKDACKLKNDKPGDKVPGSPGVPRNFPPYQYQPAPLPRPPAAAGR